MRYIVECANEIRRGLFYVLCKKPEAVRLTMSLEIEASTRLKEKDVVSLLYKTVYLVVVVSGNLLSCCRCWSPPLLFGRADDVHY